MEIRGVAAAADLTAIRQLFREYFAWIARDLAIDMSYQGDEAELAALPGAYAPPQGRLLLVCVDGQAAGCVALRPLEAGVCELKRMYVRPLYRGRGLGWTLGQAIVAAAREIGYRRMRLDTEASLTVAQGIYLSLGFRPVDQYYPVPPEMLARTVFMELALDEA